MKKSLPNYLRRYRKELGLSQRDVAYLLGTKTPGMLSRYEQFLRQPRLETALKCAHILSQSLGELFKGVREDAEAQVRRNARRLRRKYLRGTGNPVVQRKICTLEAIIKEK